MWIYNLSNSHSLFPFHTIFTNLLSKRIAFLCLINSTQDYSKDLTNARRQSIDNQLRSVFSLKTVMMRNIRDLSSHYVRWKKFRYSRLRITSRLESGLVTSREIRQAKWLKSEELAALLSLILGSSRMSSTLLWRRLRRINDDEFYSYY